MQGQLNLLKVVEAHLTSKTNFYGKKLNSYEQLIKFVGACAPQVLLPMLIICSHLQYLLEVLF